MTLKELLATYSQAYKENERYVHFKDDKMAERHYSNYLDYKKMPSLEEIKKDLSYLQAEQKDYKRDYAMLFFAEKEDLTKSTVAYLEEEGFILSKHIIFTNKLENLKLRRADLKNILIEELDKEWLPAYLDLKYHQNLEFGEDFAKLMFEFNKHNLPEKGSRIYIAREGNKLVGDVTAWYFDDYVEIDDFSVVKEYQGRGIGSALQLKASEGYNKLILVSKEINRKMYEHQGYKEVAYYWTALRSSRKS